MRVGRLTLNVTGAIPWADVPDCIKRRRLDEPSVHCPLFPDCPCSMTDCLTWCLPCRNGLHSELWAKNKRLSPSNCFQQDILITPARKVTNIFVRFKPKIHKQSLGAGMHLGRGSGVIWTPTLSLHGASFSLNTPKTSLSETQELFLSITSKMSMANGVRLSPSGFDVWACSSGLFI